ncbi:hypothetical protein [Halorubrum aethiopicum]|uniref:hypothetical protein n=1 Tax=Halorubrum aethiopicum TaxID=1758255 RepID=UPI0008313F96|nr:hypothetical protein [Halorubrum aethiopicum]
MSADARVPIDRAREWQVVATVPHSETDIDVEEIEPETGLTQRAARELANERNRAGVARPTIQWKAEPTERLADRDALVDCLR